jgi:hypothetical protein
MPDAASFATLEAFELAVAKGENERALALAIALLKVIDDRYGRVDAIGGPDFAAPRRVQRIATRFAAAFGRLICDAGTPLTSRVYEQLMAHHRWIELMFSVGGFAGPDHLVPLLATGEGQARRVPQENLARFLLLFSAAAGMDLNLDEAMRADAPAMIGAALGYLATRFVFTDAGHAFRERLLEWLPARLAQVKLGDLALQNLASPYMHCSYAASPAKHAVKAPMMAQMRRALLEAGACEYDPGQTPPDARSTPGPTPRPPPRPTIVVTCENFSFGHSIWRTHSQSVAALKARFRVVGFMHAQHVSAEIGACFDEVVAYEREGTFLELARAVAADILARRPALVLHLGVGMSPIVIALASLRLAPAQAASFGHTATTASPQIDWMILPDDFVGDPALFTERLLRLPPAAMPYRVREGFDYAAARERACAARAGGGPIRIAAPASAMKLGPPFFDCVAAAAAAARRPVELHVFPLGGVGLGFAELRRRLGERLPFAVVHEETSYDVYADRLAACDFFVCPFPYGNMNSIVDAALLGLPGVCLDGPEAHAHADAAYFRRMGLPEALITTTRADYVAAIVRLADDPAWLANCRAIAAQMGPHHPFFAGDASLFAEAVAGIARQVMAHT